MQVLLTTCTAEKDPTPDLLPAIHRYIHPRIEAAVELAASRRLPLFIFSGFLGLLDAHTPIPLYDKALQPIEAAPAARALARTLRQRGITQITALLERQTAPGWAPYWAAIEGGCEEATVGLTVELWTPRVSRGS